MKLIYRALIFFADRRVDAFRKKMRQADASMRLTRFPEERTYWTCWYREYERQAGNWGFQAETLRKLIA